MSNSDYAHFLNTYGIKLDGGPALVKLDSDPIITGYDVPVGSFLLRSDIPSTYQKIGALATDWIKLNTDSAGLISMGVDNDQTGTSYLLVLSDSENVTVYMNNASPNTVTIPTDTSVAFPVGTKINIMMEGAGVTTIQVDSGITINGVLGGSVVINHQYQGATIIKRGANTWMVSGDIT